MKRIILGAVAALFLSAGQAAADGLPSKSQIKGPEYSAAPNWNGFYIGAGIGVSAAVTDISAFGGVATFEGVGGEGVFGTVSIGYDRVLRPGWVAGVFVDYDFGGAQTDASFGPFNASFDQNYTWAIGARLGFLANPSTLVYGTAGYTETEFELSVGGLGSLSETYRGYFLGAGIETFLHTNWTAKLEYRFAQYDDEPLFPGAPAGFIDLEPSTHSVRAVLSYKFGHRD